MSIQSSSFEKTSHSLASRPDMFVLTESGRPT